MGSAKIMVIRRVEKPVPGEVKGARIRGLRDGDSLIALGWQRAGAPVGFFVKPAWPAIIKPDHFFAVRFESRMNTGVHSRFENW